MKKKLDKKNHPPPPSPVITITITITTISTSFSLNLPPPIYTYTHSIGKINKFMIDCINVTQQYKKTKF